MRINGRQQLTATVILAVALLRLAAAECSPPDDSDANSTVRCSNHGRCESGWCVCDVTYVSEFCQHTYLHFASIYLPLKWTLASLYFLVIAFYLWRLPLVLHGRMALGTRTETACQRFKAAASTTQCVSLAIILVAAVCRVISVLDWFGVEGTLPIILVDVLNVSGMTFVMVAGGLIVRFFAEIQAKFQPSIRSAIRIGDALLIALTVLEHLSLLGLLESEQLWFKLYDITGGVFVIALIVGQEVFSRRMLTGYLANLVKTRHRDDLAAAAADPEVHSTRMLLRVIRGVQLLCCLAVIGALVVFALTKPYDDFVLRIVGDAVLRAIEIASMFAVLSLVGRRPKSAAVHPTADSTGSGTIAAGSAPSAAIATAARSGKVYVRQARQLPAGRPS